MSGGCRSQTKAVPGRSLLFPGQVFGMASTVKDARNKIEHSLILSPNLWAEAWRDARHLAASLGFDLAKATRRLERKRWLQTDEQLKALGYPEGIHAIAKTDQ
ncbi:MAG TPA: hypothetical protein VM305_03970 [Candidatus Limnocylindrales bacterium]|nr:hypothetical protein [Candidatus Limnocylindrales bacterium]